ESRYGRRWRLVASGQDPDLRRARKHLVEGGKPAKGGVHSRAAVAITIHATVAVLGLAAIVGSGSTGAARVCPLAGDPVVVEPVIHLATGWRSAGEGLRLVIAAPPVRGDLFEIFQEFPRLFRLQVREDLAEIVDRDAVAVEGAAGSVMSRAVGHP